MKTQLNAAARIRAFTIQEKLENLKTRRTEAMLKDGSGCGESAAGILFMAQDTGRFLLQQRSMDCDHGGTWAAFGGTTEPGETPEQTATREVMEEAGHQIITPLYHLYTDEHPTSGFKYHNFITTVPNEFEPSLNEESLRHCWAAPGEFPKPLHPGFANFLNQADDEIQSHMRGEVEEL